MKKLLIVFAVLLLVNTAVNAATQKIYTTNDGTKLKCTGKKTDGSISQYDKGVVDYYEFKNGKLYSHNMLDDFARESNQKKSATAVKKLKISDSEIKFKDTYYSHAWANYKWATINRSNGNYYFKAKRDNVHGGFNKKAQVTGKCTIIK